MQNKRFIELGALKIFSVVAESETLTKAAERLGITQSAVSQAIKQLEEQTRTNLVARRSRPIKLTQSGQVLYKYANKMLSDTRRMLNEVKSADSNKMAHINVGMIDSFCDVFGEKFLMHSKDYASGVSLKTGYSQPLSQALVERDLDMLFTSDPISEHPELDSYPLLRDPFVMIAPRLREAEGKNVDWYAENLPFIHYDRIIRIGVMTDLIARRLKLDLKTCYTIDNTPTLLRCVEQGYGWAIASGLCVVRYPELLKKLKVMDLDNGANARYISLMCRRNEMGDLPEKIASFIRSAYDNDTLPQLFKVSPWLEKRAFSITETPLI